MIETARGALDLEQGDRGSLRSIEMAAPDFGEVVEIRPGLLWTRLALPMAMDHNNVYFIEDDGGWAILDAGFGDQPTLDAWEALLAGPLRVMTFTRLFVTHAHYDHSGAAGWLCRRLGLPLWMNREEYMTSRLDTLQPSGGRSPELIAFLGSLGVPEADMAGAMDHAERFPAGITTLPRFYDAVEEGEVLLIGKRSFRCYFGPGHATAQLMFYCVEENWFFSADHILSIVAPLLIQSPLEPHGDFYGKYLRSLEEIERDIPVDALVLPGHDKPFIGLHAAIESHRRHHLERIRLLLEKCAERPQTIPELAPYLFPGTMNGRKMHYAVFEILAYANRLQREGKIAWIREGAIWQIASAV